MNNLNQSRTLAARLFAAALLLASAGSALAAVRYVDVNSTNATPPYASWASAAANIQDAVDAAVAGDEIVVTNGVYATGGREDAFTTTNRVMVDKPLMLRSVNGPEFTIIDGAWSVRCVSLTDNASLSGFTLTNGVAGRFFTSPIVSGRGAGVRCAAQSAVVSNCVIAGNVARNYGTGGGAYGGTLNNCALIGNAAYHGDVCHGSQTRCSGGGGAAGCTLNNCTLIDNWALEGGGGASGCTLNNCTLTGNNRGGALFCTLNNCTLTGNSAGGAVASALNNCTLTGNDGGALSYVESFEGDTSVSPSTLNNCVSYFNSHGNYDSSSTLNYSCTTPQPTNGFGNITNAPLFVNSASGNFRLRPDSPCIDAGTNLSASITNDLDGRPRPLDGNGDGLAAFDMGAYEYRTPLLVWQDSPNPTPPHADWSTAAHTIQDAVDAAVAGDEIVVTNGVYATGGRAADGTMTNRVAVDKPLTLRSVNGPQFTIIQGHQVPDFINGDGAVRCVYLANGTSLSGFTLTNGATGGPYGHPTSRESNGGGLWCESTSTVVWNCVLAGNSALDGGGVYGGTLNNCTLSSNVALNSGGAAASSTLNNCTLTGNRASYGGGAAGGILNNCTLTHNLASFYWIRANNSLYPSSTGHGGGALGCILNNCLLSSNSAVFGGGVNGCTLNNCTVTGNSVDVQHGSYYDRECRCMIDVHYGGRGGGAFSCMLSNSIVYFNHGGNWDSCVLDYSCTTPLLTNGVGNITNAPLFVDLASGNLRLQSNSPCINAGLNAFAPAGPDLDGNLRIEGGTVDMGAYELSMPQLTITSSASNVVLSWPATYAFRYILQATTNLAFPDRWTAVSPEQVVVNGQNVVTNSISATEQFYRLKLRCPNAGPAPSPDPRWFLSRDTCSWIFLNGPGGGN